MFSQIAEITEDASQCFFWHGGLGNRGATEIGSCVLQYLQDVAMRKPNTDVVFYSDNCGGQQKNKLVFEEYYQFLYHLNNFIDHLHQFYSS